jgi:hypothetical protein
MNSYRSVFGFDNIPSGKNQFEVPIPKNEASTNAVVEDKSSTNAVVEDKLDTALILKFLEIVSKDQVNEHLSSEEKFEIAKKLVQNL